MNAQIFNYAPQNVKQFQKSTVVVFIILSLMVLFLGGMMWANSGFDIVMLEIMGLINTFVITFLTILMIYRVNILKRLLYSQVELTDHEIKYVAYQQPTQHIVYSDITAIKVIQGPNGEVRQIEVTSRTTSLILNGFERMMELLSGIKANLPPNTPLDQQQDKVANGNLRRFFNAIGFAVIASIVVIIIILPYELNVVRVGILVISGLTQIFVTRYYNKNKSSKPRLLFEVMYALILVGMGLFSVKYSFTELDRIKGSSCSFWNKYVNDSGCQSMWDGSGKGIVFLPNGWLVRPKFKELQIQDIRGWGWSQFSLAHDDYLGGFTVSTDGQFIVTRTFGETKDKLWSWDVRQKKLLQQQTVPESIVSITFVPHGSQIALVLAGDKYDLIELWEATTLQKIRTLPNVTVPIAFSADGQLVAGMSTKKNIIELTRLSDEAVVQSISLPNKDLYMDVNYLTFSSRGDFLAAQLNITNILVWQLVDGKIHNQWIENRFIRGGMMAISPDSQYVAVGLKTEGDWSTSRSYVNILRIADSQLLNTISLKQRESLTSLAFSPDGKLLAIGTSSHINGTLIFDVATLVQPK